MTLPERKRMHIPSAPYPAEAPKVTYMSDAELEKINARHAAGEKSFTTVPEPDPNDEWKDFRFQKWGNSEDNNKEHREAA